MKNSLFLNISKFARLLLAFALALVVLAGGPGSQPALAAPGNLDSSFDGDGRLMTDFNLFDADAYGAAVQPDGKLIVVGYVKFKNVNQDFAVVRYNTDGSLDPTFDTDGMTSINFSGTEENEYAQDVAIQSDGKIVVVGRAGSYPDQTFAVVRLNSDGSPDTTFDTDGKLTTAIGTEAIANCVAIQTDNKIVVAGNAKDGTEYKTTFVRYNSNGSLDTTFDADGKAWYSISTGLDTALDVAIHSGKIIAAGRAYTGSNHDFAVIRLNSDGSLDTTFDTDGKVTTSIGSGDDWGYSLAIQSDSKIIVAGNSYGASEVDFALVRYNSNGSLDTTFDTDGRVTTKIGDNWSGIFSVLIQTDGKIVAVGSSSDEEDIDYSMSAARYNSNGSLDTTFSGDGKVTTAFSFWNGAHAAALQPGGKIILAGYAQSGPERSIGVLRLDTTGSVDNSFAENGLAITTLDSNKNLANAFALQPDGKIVAAGYVSDGTDADFALARYHSNGSLDRSFNLDGRVVTVFGGASDRANAVAIQPDGKIVAAGVSDDDFALARYNSNGSLDSTFSDDGKVTTAISTSQVYGVAIQADGKIVAVGSTESFGNEDFALVRYNSDGSQDTTFSGDGLQTTNISAYDRAHSVAIQPDGKIILAGTAAPGGNSDFAVVRYLTNGSLDTSFGGDGIVTTPLMAGNDLGRSVLTQPDGKIVVAGYSYNGTTYDFAVVRYLTNGSLDASFSDDGINLVSFSSADDFGHSVALQFDGKIVIGGYGGATHRFAVTRLNTDGEVDITFATLGKAILNIGNVDDIAYGLAIQPDGRIVLAGQSITSSGDHNFGLIRLMNNSWVFTPLIRH